MTDTPMSFVAEAATLDPAVRERVLALANRALDEAEFLMIHGDPNMRGQLIRSFITAFSKHLKAEERNNEMEQLKATMQELRDAVMGHTPGGEPEPEPPDFDDTLVDSPSNVTPIRRK